MTFAALAPGAMLIVMERWNPSVPLVLLVSILAVVGAALSMGERARRRRAAALS